MRWREALEAAREAEAALLALEHDTDQDDHGNDARDDGSDGPTGAGKGPIHRVKIEAAELVPAHSGRAQRGFVAHVHREAGQPWRGAPAGSTNGSGSAAGSSYGDGMGSQQGPANGVTSLRSPRPGQLPSEDHATRPETHVFADHRELVNFLRDEFAEQSKR